MPTSRPHEVVADRDRRRAVPPPACVEAITDADLVIVPPSNPIVSVGTDPRRARASARSCARRRRPWSGSPASSAATTSAAWPARCSAIRGVEVSAAGVAEHYGARSAAGVLDGWLVDTVDAGLVERVEAAGIACRAVPLMMTDHDATADMAAAAVDLVRR